MMILINCVQSEDCANIVDCVFCTHERDLAMHVVNLNFCPRSGPNAWENGCCACERETEPKCVSLTPNAWDLVGLRWANLFHNKWKSGGRIGIFFPNNTQKIERTNSVTFSFVFTCPLKGSLRDSTSHSFCNPSETVPSTPPEAWLRPHQELPALAGLFSASLFPVSDHRAHRCYPSHFHRGCWEKQLLVLQF